jgi:predicted secreted hydrolase
MKPQHAQLGWLWVWVLMAGCDPMPSDGVSEEAANQAANVTNFLGGEADTSRFARALAPRDFSFPLDHGPHPEFRTEWWYLTGNLATARDRHFGFQLTFFRFALPVDERERPSAWSTDQLWMAHFTVTDSEGGEFFADEKFERQALGLAGAQSEPFRVWLADWELASRGQSLFPLTLNARNDLVALTLDLNPGKPLVLQGEAGLDAKGPAPGNASYYYSFTRLPAAGVVQVRDESYPVSGTAWMDREWSTSVLGADLEGWDWFALQLDDGSDLMFYRLRRRDQTMSSFSNGVVVAADGTVTARITAEQVRLIPTAQWRSPRTGARYDRAWALDIPDLALKLSIQARIPEQELDLTVRYWEGAVVVEGTRSGSPVSGVGYTEIVGVTARDR